MARSPSKILSKDETKALALEQLIEEQRKVFIKAEAVAIKERNKMVKLIDKRKPSYASAPPVKDPLV